MTDPSTNSGTRNSDPAPGEPVIIAIDGPAGSGKSSVSKSAADRLGFGFLDTGAAYRALAWFALRSDVDTADAASVAALLPGFRYEISLDPAEAWVRVDDIDVTAAIRDPVISATVSGVARVPAVRTSVNEMFRRMVARSGRPGVVVEGRDITTVVAPDAPVRILLTADPAVRAARRSAELDGSDKAAVAAALHRRDASDSRVVDFLTAAPGVTVVDSTTLDFDQTVEAVLGVIDEMLAAAGGKVRDGR